MYKGPERKFKTKKIKTKRVMKLSEYGQQLVEKQKLRHAYSVRERTLKNYFLNASRKKVNVDLSLIQLLEKRLDNTIYRLGWAVTRPQAAQMVSHGHIQVNGKTVKIPSYQLSQNQIIEIKSTKKDIHPFRDFALRLEKYTPPEWLKFISKDKTKAQITGEVTHQNFTEPLNLSLVLQFYSR